MQGQPSVSHPQVIDVLEIAKEDPAGDDTKSYANYKDKPQSLECMDDTASEPTQQVNNVPKTSI